jgi:hypothetical protein
MVLMDVTFCFSSLKRAGWARCAWPNLQEPNSALANAFVPAGRVAASGAPAVLRRDRTLGELRNPYTGRHFIR